MINIRAATSADAKLIFDLIVELAVYEKAPHEVVTDENGISDSLFGPTARAKALVCEVDGRAVSVAMAFIWKMSTCRQRFVGEAPARRCCVNWRR